MSWPTAIVIVMCVAYATLLILFYIGNRHGKSVREHMERMKTLEIEHERVRPLRGLLGETRPPTPGQRRPSALPTFPPVGDSEGET